ncbi:universal stress protein [Sphingomonadales bacterium 58]|uniref:universal stress protein n=1 Tax=Sphingobium sp. S8 TaxID=2758385 RepID=UPI00191AADEF|nr:universal stress protein [Sphingobium sp. S8]MBY2958986.1 universal stress protein [Sphingomonadales bacterium 58]CAD7338186.1 hypothetical protein SPHS8_01933 [Sphingobium sp. S8]
MSIGRIVAAVALEADVDPVAARALQLARMHGAHLILVHVLENLILIEDDVAAWSALATLRQTLQDQARERIAHLLAGQDCPNVEIMIEHGRAHERIEAIAEAQKADLLVIGPGNPRTLGDKLFGSTADRLTRSGFSPVLVVRTPPKGPYRHVTAALDFSSSSAQALARAAELASQPALQIVHVVDWPLPFEQAMLKVGTPMAEIEAYRRGKVQTARASIDALLGSNAPAGLAPNIRIIEGQPGDVLTGMSREGSIDLLAIGAHGRNIVARALLGSVARQVLQGAACDVLIVSAT